MILTILFLSDHWEIDLTIWRVTFSMAIRAVRTESSDVGAVKAHVQSRTV
jgi:hypothetical protein